MYHPTPALEVAVAHHIATLTLHNPGRKNALTSTMLKQVPTAVQQAQEQGARVLMLVGHGHDFGAGIDLLATTTDLQAGVTEYVRSTLNPAVDALRTTPLPVVACVRGACVGLSLSLALAADLVYCATDARLGGGFLRLGLSTDGGLAYSLLQRVPYPIAYELLAFSEWLTGAQAAEIGLVNRALPEAELTEYVYQQATRLAAGPAQALAALKANLADATQGWPHLLEQEAVRQGGLSVTKDFAEGVQAFLEKREPNFGQ